MKDHPQDRRTKRLLELRGDFERQTREWRAAMHTLSALGTETLLVRAEFLQELDRLAAPLATSPAPAGLRV
jgi:hypothetical protein